MSDFLISFQTNRQQIRRRRVTCGSMKQALELGKVLNATVGAQAIVVKPLPRIVGR